MPRSEFIVRSGHSCQENPLTIEEVRRILLKNLGETNTASEIKPPFTLKIEGTNMAPENMPTPDARRSLLCGMQA